MTWSVDVIHHRLTRSTGTRTEELLRFLTRPSRSRSRGPRPAAGARPQTRSDRTSSSPAAAETGHTAPDLQTNGFRGHWRNTFERFLCACFYSSRYTVNGVCGCFKYYTTLQYVRFFLSVCGLCSSTLTYETKWHEKFWTKLLQLRQDT